MVTQDELTAYLEQVVRGWPRQPLYPGCAYGLGYRTRGFPGPYHPPAAYSTTPDVLARQLLASAEFRALRLGSWLQSPDGRLITAAVESLSPPPLREDIELLVAAVTLAARLQQSQARGTAAAAIVVGTLTTMAMSFLVAMVRRAT